MKTGKLIWYNILAFIASMLVIHLTTRNGLSAFSWSSQYFFNTIGLGFLSVLAIFISTLLVNLSYAKTAAKTKKNLLKLSLIIILILTIISVIYRIINIFNGIFPLNFWLLTIVYIAMTVLNIYILKDLFRLIRKLFNDNY